MQRLTFQNRAFEALLFSLPLLVANLYFKTSCLRSGGFKTLAAHLGVLSLSPVTYGRLFASEVLETLLLFPLALLLLGGWLNRPRLRYWIYAVVLELALLTGVISWAVFNTIGRFPTSTLVLDFVNALRMHPELVGPSAVLSPGVIAKGGIILATGAIPLLLVGSTGIRELWGRHAATLGVCVLLLAGVSEVLLLTAATGSVFDRGHFHRLIGEVSSARASTAPRAARSWTPAALKAEYEQIVFPGGRPSLATLPSLPGRTVSNPNVIYIVLETADAADYSIDGPNPRMPNVANLRRHGLLARNHYSTDPFSLRANFTLYSSVYDLAGFRPFAEYLLAQKSRPLDSVPRLLRDRGYATRYYFPHALWPQKVEGPMLQHLGFEDIWLWPYSSTDGRSVGERDSLAEREVYGKAMEDLGELHAQGRPFFMAIVNSIGHAPYADVRSVDRLAAEGRGTREVLVGNLAHLMDDLIGTLVAKLEELGLLEKTILVITGDHGPRNRVDNPAIDTQYANEMTYHVPLLIHYPPLFPSPRVVEHVTSHVDVGPTVLHLMGLYRPDYLQQGMPMLDDGIAERITFFLGLHYTGMEALHYKGRFFMMNSLLQAAYLNDRFLFSPPDLVGAAAEARRAEEAQRLEAALRRLTEVQWAWIAYLTYDGGERSSRSGSDALAAEDEPRRR